MDLKFNKTVLTKRVFKIAFLQHYIVRILKPNYDLFVEGRTVFGSEALSSYSFWSVSDIVLNYKIPQLII